MGSDLDILEIALRGAAAGISLLLAIVMFCAQPKSRTRRLAGLFVFSVGVYVLVASDMTQRLFVGAMPLVTTLAIWGTVFFWWFAASLFDDRFQWRWWRVAPAIILPAFYLWRTWMGEGFFTTLLSNIHILLNGLLFADALRLAVMNAGDDLVDPRRRFRIVMAASVALFGMGIAAVEFMEHDDLLPEGLLLFHACAIFALNVFFGAWLLSAPDALMADATAEEAKPTALASLPNGLRAADKPIFDKLMGKMEEGTWRREGLSIAQLAAEVETPPHVLRRIINQELGYRNFSSFLSKWRIAEAKKVLSDPVRARDQILQIALEVGYGSVAPFNRAFKDALGVTPSEFRKAAMESANAEANAGTNLGEKTDQS